MRKKQKNALLMVYILVKIFYKHHIIFVSWYKDLIEKKGFERVFLVFFFWLLFSFVVFWDIWWCFSGTAHPFYVKLSHFVILPLAKTTTHNLIEVIQIKGAGQRSMTYVNDDLE